MLSTGGFVLYFVQMYIFHALSYIIHIHTQGTLLFFFCFFVFGPPWSRFLDINCSLRPRLVFILFCFQPLIFFLFIFNFLPHLYRHRIFFFVFLKKNDSYGPL